MDASEKARQAIVEMETSLRCVEENDEIVARATVAMAYAAREQTEAARPRWVRIGSRVINLAHVAYIDLHTADFDGDRNVEVVFAASGESGMALVFDGDEYAQAVTRLSDALYGWVVDPVPEGADLAVGPFGDIGVDLGNVPSY
jgi:hypothetical protein